MTQQHAKMMRILALMDEAPLKKDPATLRSAPMTDAPALQPRLPVTVLMQCTPLPDHPWLSERRTVVSVLPRLDPATPRPTATATAEPTDMATPQSQLLRFDNLVLELHPDEAENYYLNISTTTPRCFVVMQEASGTTPPEPLLVTASADLAASYESVDHEVAVVTLDPALYLAVETFALTHYIPQEFVKRKRKNWTQP